MQCRNATWIWIYVVQLREYTEIQLNTHATQPLDKHRTHAIYRLGYWETLQVADFSCPSPTLTALNVKLPKVLWLAEKPLKTIFGLSATNAVSDFYLLSSTCPEVSGVENIGQCRSFGRTLINQSISFISGKYSLLTHLLRVENAQTIRQLVGLYWC